MSPPFGRQHGQVSRGGVRFQNRWGIVSEKVPLSWGNDSKKSPSPAMDHQGVEAVARAKSCEVLGVEALELVEREVFRVFAAACDDLLVQLVAPGEGVELGFRCLRFGHGQRPGGRLVVFGPNPLNPLTRTVACYCPSTPTPSCSGRPSSAAACATPVASGSSCRTSCSFRAFGPAPPARAAAVVVVRWRADNDRRPPSGLTRKLRRRADCARA